MFANIRKQLEEGGEESKTSAYLQAKQKTLWDMEDINPNKFDSSSDDEGGKGGSKSNHGLKKGDSLNSSENNDDQEAR
jgi:hypothetical protein